MAVDQGNNEAILNLSLTKVFSLRLDENPDLMALHIGDRVIDVNGHSIHGSSSIRDIQKIIDDTDRVLQLTIEHEPNTITRRNPISGELEFLTTQAVSRNASSSSISPAESMGPPPPKLDKARIAMRMDEGYMSGTPKKFNKLQRNQKPSHQKHQRKFNCQQSSNSLRDGKERSSSMSKLLLGQNSAPDADQMYDLSRTKSFRVEPPNGAHNQRIFRASDLVIGEMLGRGFFGQVYKVTHKETKEVMVLKELYRWVDDDAQRNFLKEVAVLRSLHHRNVLRFIGVLYKEKKLHLITEYISGGTLATLLHGPAKPELTWTEKIHFARDISLGMTYLHTVKIIHRDLNSHNCLVRDGNDRTVIVADFGLARLCRHNPNDGHGTVINRKSQKERRKRYTVVGSPWWMAPEMLRGNKYDEKVDVFSFGIIMCEIIGRVQADPDFMPRTDDFGLNQQQFIEAFCRLNDDPCPEMFYKIAFLCCDLNPDRRPSFKILAEWFDRLAIHGAILGSHHQPPSDLAWDIQNFHGEASSNCNTPEVNETPPKFVIEATKDEVDSTPVKEEKVPEIIARTMSPHLAKDFTPNGDRIRDSWRARRKQRIRENHQQVKKSLEVSTPSEVHKKSAVATTNNT